MGDRGELAWREMALVTGGQFVLLTDGGNGSDKPRTETSHHVEGYNVSDLDSIVFSLLKQEVENQR